MWFRIFSAAEFAFDEFLVVKIFVRQSYFFSAGFVRPASVFVRAAFGAGFGVGRDFGAADGTEFGTHFRMVEGRMQNAEKSIDWQLPVSAFCILPSALVQPPTPA